VKKATARKRLMRERVKVQRKRRIRRIKNKDKRDNIVLVASIKIVL